MRNPTEPKAEPNHFGESLTPNQYFHVPELPFLNSKKSSSGSEETENCFLEF